MRFTIHTSLNGDALCPGGPGDSSSLLRWLQQLHRIWIPPDDGMLLHAEIAQKRRTGRSITEHSIFYHRLP